jgi:hypothetical protein
MFPFCRLNANFSYKRVPYRTRTRIVCRDFSIKNLNLVEFIRKARTAYRDAFLYEKSIKTDIYAVRFALLTLFSFKKRNFKQYASSGKMENFRQKKRNAWRLETASVIKIVTENGRLRYGTVRYATVR